MNKVVKEPWEIDKPARRNMVNKVRFSATFLAEDIGISIRECMPPHIVKINCAAAMGRRTQTLVPRGIHLNPAIVKIAMVTIKLINGAPNLVDQSLLVGRLLYK